MTAATPASGPPSPALVDRIMVVMEAAFDPVYGEAWTRRQVADALTLANTHALVIDADGAVIDEGSAAAPAGFVLTRHVLNLFDQLFERRQLIRLIGVKFSGLVSGSYQIDLFEDTIEQIELLKQMDHIRKRFGSGAVMRASGNVLSIPSPPI